MKRIIVLIFVFIGLQTIQGQTKKTEFYRTKKGEKYHKKECKTIKEKDTLIGFLKKNPKNNKSTSFQKETTGSKKAILHYKAQPKVGLMTC